MDGYVIELDLRGRPVLVVGGGSVAERKVDRLVEAGARITIVSPELTPSLAGKVAEGVVSHEPRRFFPEDIDGQWLVFAATNDLEINHRIASLCDAQGIPVNVVNAPERCTFNVPAQLRRGHLTVSISTGGRSPALARYVRQLLEREIGEEFGELLDLLADLRPQMQERFPDVTERRRRWRRMVGSEVLALLREHRREEAERVLQSCMS